MQIEGFYRLSDPNLRPRVCQSTSLKTLELHNTGWAQKLEIEFGAF